MTANLSAQRGALVLVFVGIALALAGSVLALLTDDPKWRYLVAGGGAVQFVGWVLYGRGRRGVA